MLEGAHYLEFLRERLILLRELLADDGSIYVHLDDNMAFLAKAVNGQEISPGYNQHCSRAESALILPRKRLY